MSPQHTHPKALHHVRSDTYRDQQPGSLTSPRHQSPPPAARPVALTIDDLGTPLHTVDFCVVDLETTGGRASDLGITEIGAVKVRGGVVVGEFHTLINPGAPIPAAISLLTGITDADVAHAPRLPAVFASFLEFSRDCVMVAHNAPYDMGYLNAAATEFGYQWQPRAVVDTAKLSRATLGRDEVANHKLGTLARYFKAHTTPIHRALDDARATVDVLHGLMERLGPLGVTELEDLLGYTRKVSQTQRRKRHLADGLPSAPGVYIFEDGQGATLYVGTSQNIKQRVRSYFTASEKRSRMAEMLNIAEHVTSLVCASPLEASVRELRLIGERKPPYNRKSRFPERGRWLKLTIETVPRLSLVRQPADDQDQGAAYLGPMSKRTADEIIAVFQATFGLRTCTHRISPTRPTPSCSLADMGRCCAPCLGGERIAQYLDLSATPARQAMRSGGSAVVTATLGRIRSLSEEQRFEEAAHTLASLRTFIRVADRYQQRHALTAAGEVVAAERIDGDWVVHVIRYGRLAGAARCSATESTLTNTVSTALATSATVVQPSEPTPASSSEEVDLLLRWLDKPGVRLIDASKPWSLPLDSVGAHRTLTSLSVGASG
jgi:DNA polymerase III subunit epsilon